MFRASRRLITMAATVLLLMLAATADRSNQAAAQTGSGAETKSTPKTTPPKTKPKVVSKPKAAPSTEKAGSSKPVEPADAEDEDEETEATPEPAILPIRIIDTQYDKSVWNLAFSPDGKTLASSGVGDFDYSKLWDVFTGQPLRTLKIAGSGAALTFSPDGKTLAVGGDLMDVASGEVSGLDGSPSGRVVYRPDGKILAIANGGLITLWDVSTKKLLKTLSGIAIAFSPDGKTLAIATTDDRIKLLDASANNELKTISDADSRDVAFSPDGKTLFGSKMTTRLWDVSTGQLLRTLPGGTSVALSPDGKTLAVVHFGREIKLWDTSTGQVLRTIPGTTNFHLAFSPDGKTLATTRGGKIYLWDISK
jgi:WD40 repeat protein